LSGFQLYSDVKFQGLFKDIKGSHSESSMTIKVQHRTGLF